MKASNAMLAAWFVVIAGLVFAIALFSLKGCDSSAPAPSPPNPKVATPPSGKSPTPATPPRRATERHPATPQKPPTIVGVVHGPDGQPVGGATVAVHPPARPGPPPTPPNMDEIRWLYSVLDQISAEEWDLPRPLATWTAPDIDTSQGEKEIASATSGDDGKFTLTIPRTAASPPYRLVAAKQGVGTAAISNVSPGGDPIQITLGAATLVRGTVVTEVGGNAVPGARVAFDDGARRFAAVTDAEGRFAIEGLVPGFYQLSVAAKGRTPLFDHRYRIGANDATPLTLKMPNGALLRVKAVVEKLANPSPAAASGREVQPGPLPNAQLVAYSEENYAYVLATTNAQGVAEFPGMPAGTYHVNGRAPGVVSVGGSEVRIDRNDQVKDETVTFEPAVETPVEVVDEDGRPVAGVDFYAGNADEKYDALRSVKVGTTDAQGKFKFPFEEAGTRCAIFGFKDGYGVVRASPDDYQAGEPLRLVAKKGLRVHGVVKSTDGKAIADAVVSITVTLAEADANDVELEIRTNADGRYDFPYLPHGENVEITATAPDGISEEDGEITLAPGKTDYTVDITIDLEPAKAPPAPAHVPGTPPKRPQPQPNPQKEDGKPK